MLGLTANITVQETEEAEFERKRRLAEELAEAKTAKNRAKRQKKKERAKVTGSESGQTTADGKEAPIKKRRLVNGKELVFRKPGEDSGDEDSEDEAGPKPVIEVRTTADGNSDGPSETPRVLDTPRITIHEDD